MRKKNSFGGLKAYPKRLVFIILLCLFAALFITIQKKLSTPEDQSQYSDSGKTKWPVNLIFGDEDKEMFPVISNPKYVSDNQARTFLEDADVMYIFRYGGKTYVYPAVILSFHHIVNDTIGDKPIAMTLCLLSGSAAVYERKIGDTVFDFGVLGNLYNGNLIMYDLNSNSYWLQLTGKAFEGLMTNERLTTLASIEVTTWKDLKGEENLMILPPIREMKFYREFYASFLKSPFGLESLNGRKQNPRFEAFTTGIGISIQNTSKFYPVSAVKKKNIINDTVGGWSLLIVHDPLLNTPRIFRRFADEKALTFELSSSGLKDKETQSLWDMSGRAVAGPLRGTRLANPVYTHVYWYSWSAFYPDTLIFE